MAPSPSFSVTAEPERDLIRLRLSGFFTAEVAAKLVEARNAAHRQLRCGPNQHVTIADLRDMAIQPQDLLAHFGALIADPAYRSRRAAVVTASALARMQTQRTASESRLRFFDDMAEAEAWLLEPQPPG